MIRSVQKPTFGEWIKARCIVSENGCWDWQLSRDDDGYGRITYGGRAGHAHRFSYQYFVGPIPAGLCLDHLCRVRHCCNPLHLEPVTPRENTLRGTSMIVGQLAVTHCPQGHAYAGDNLMIRASGGRECRACHRIRDAESYQRKKQRMRMGGGQ